MAKMLQGRFGRGLMATALAAVAGLAFWLATPQPTDAQTSATSGYQQVSAGRFHSCAVSGASAISCWGSNTYGQTNAPAGNYRQVDAGAFHTCAVSETGAVSCWGSNTYGQTNAPAGSYQQVSAGDFHSCALSQAGAITCWGSNGYGQASAPAGSYSEVRAGNFYSCGVSQAGSFTCWGSRTYRPRLQGGPYRQWSAGSFHSCGVTEAGAITCWGLNSSGQGNAPNGRYRQVSAGQFHTCAVSEAGAVACWGSNVYGQANAPAAPIVEEEPSADPPRPTIGERHSDGYFPLSFGEATLGQLKASGTVLTVELNPADSVTGPTGRSVVAFRPGPAGDGPASTGLDLAALATLRNEVGAYGDYDGEAHGGLAIPDLPVYVRYAPSASSTLREAVLKVTLVPASGEPQAATRTISVVPPAAPTINVAGMLRGDDDQTVDLAQLAELAIGLRLVPALSDGEAAQTKTCLSALAASPTDGCPAEVALDAGSRLQISGPATFDGTNGSKVLEGGLKLRCESAANLFGGTGAACIIIRDHDGSATTPSRPPRIRINDDATRNISIDIVIVAPADTSFYAQLMNADSARPLYNDQTGSYYQLASKYTGSHSISVNCTLASETERIISGATAGPGETQVIEETRTQQCTTSAGDTKTFTQRTRHIATVSD